MAKPAADQHLFVSSLYSLIMSFSALAYQQAIALTLADITGDFVLSQAMGIGLYLLGMGLGAWRAERFLPHWTRIFYVEVGLGILGLLSVSALYAVEFIVRGVFAPAGSAGILIAASPLLLSTGVLCGMEIPLLMKWSGSSTSARILGWNYFGALLATVVTPLWLIPALDTNGTAATVSALSLLTAYIFCYINRAPLRMHLFSLFIFVLALGFIRLEPLWRATYLKSIYFRPALTRLHDLPSSLSILNRLSSPLRIRTHYQWIDILRPEFTAGVLSGQEFAIYLDRKLQFGALDIHRYHQSMVHGAINLLQKTPKRVLVLGGGDGLLLPQLLSYQHIEKIDLVELDARVLDLSRVEPTLHTLNRGALDDPRVSVHVGDAFSFIREHKEKYDLILSDLPFPVNYDLSLLFSREFFAFVKARLEQKGLFIFDFPTPGQDSPEFEVVLATLHAGGFSTPFAFGLSDSFIAVAHDNRPLGFDYSALMAKLDDSAIFNLVSRAKEVWRGQQAHARINSVFFPINFASLSRDGGRETGPLLHLPWGPNPGLLPRLLERFQNFHQNQYGSHTDGWPKALREYWRKDFTRARDFEDHLDKEVLIPRFQWVHEFTATSHHPDLMEWFDLETPQELRAAWKKAFGFAGDRPWVGVTWSPKEGTFAFHELQRSSGPAFAFITRVFKNHELVAEEITPMTNSALNPASPWSGLGNSMLVQEVIGRRFLILPRRKVILENGKKLRLYFP
jgi:spermidine synthase